MNAQKLWNASKWPITLAVLFNLLFFLLIYLFRDPLRVSSQTKTILAILFLAFYAGNLAIYIYAGYRAGKQLKAPALHGGAVSAISFTLAHSIVSFLLLLSVLFFIGSILPSDTATVPVLLLLSMLSTIYGLYIFLATLVFGLVINFLAGAAAAYWVTRKAW